MKVVDFTKKIVCSDDTIKVVQVIPVNYANSNFKYLVIYEYGQGVQNSCSVNMQGKPSLGSELYDRDVTFLNPEPQIVREFYKNIYSDGTVGSGYPTFESAKRWASEDTFGAITLQFLEFDDGTRKVRVVED